ncbi:MAG: LysR substrate-binding domain-containing protein [Casimicrobiaceae bacterium]
MALTLRHIEVIRAVLRAGTLTSAARQLAVSQPGISRVLRNAENRLGLTLFERRSGRLYPTPEVLALYPDIEKIYAEIEAVQRSAADLRRVRGGRLSVVSIPSIAATILARAIGQLASTSPELRVTLRTVLNYEVIENVRAGNAELGFTFDATSHPAVTATEIGQTRLVCILPRGHPLATKASLDARDLHEVPLVSFSGTLAIGAVLEKAFAEAGATRRIGVEVGQTFLACALVNAGAGVAVVDELVVSDLRRGFVVRPFRPQHLIRLYAVTRPERLSLAAQALLDVVAKSANVPPPAAPPDSAVKRRRKAR